MDTMDGFREAGLRIDHHNAHDALVGQSHGLVIRHHSRGLARSIVRHTPNLVTVKDGAPARVPYVCVHYVITSCASARNTSLLRPSQQRCEAHGIISLFAVRTEDICGGRRQPALADRLWRLRAYAQTASPPSATCQLVILYVDEDFWVNDGVSLAELHQRWHEQGASVLLSR